VVGLQTGFGAAERRGLIGATCPWCSGSARVGRPVSGQRNARCWNRSGRRGALGLDDARGRVVRAGERAEKGGTGEVLAAAQGAEGRRVE
jgi:hypothetical protein